MNTECLIIYVHCYVHLKRMITDLIRLIVVILYQVTTLTSCLHHIRSINDPEHPLSLEELNVVEQVRVKVSLFGSLSYYVSADMQK